MAIMSASMMLSIGIDAKVRLLAINGWEFEHAIAIAYSEDLDKWLNVDPSSENPVGWEIDYIRKRDI